MDIINKLKTEKGNVLVIVALTLPTLVFLIGFCIEVGLLYLEKSNLHEVGMIMADSRYLQMEILADSKTPAPTLDNLMKEYAYKNGLTPDQVKTKYSIVKQGNKKTMTVSIELRKRYEFTFMKIFGYDDIVIVDTIQGAEYIFKHPDINN